MAEKVLFSPPYDIREEDVRIHRRSFYVEGIGFGDIDSGPYDIIRVSFEDELPKAVFHPEDDLSGMSDKEVDTDDEASVIVLNGINEAKKALKEGKTREDTIIVIG